jgi:hypothetical protein
MSAEPSNVTSTIGHGLWMAFRWPLLIWLGWMFLRICIGPIWQAFARYMRGRR